MKIFCSIISILFISLFLGCSTSNDDDRSKKAGNLIGSWELRSSIEYDENGEILEEETFEPGASESILEIDDKFITAHEEGTLFDGQAMAYQYDPSDQVLIYLGFRVDVEWLSSNKVIFNVENSEGKNVTTWVRI